MWKKNKRQAFLIEPASCWFFLTRLHYKISDKTHFTVSGMLNIQLLNCDFVTVWGVYCRYTLYLDLGSVSVRLHSSILPPSDQTTTQNITKPPGTCFIKGWCFVWWRSNVRLEFPFFTFVCIFSVSSADSPEEQVITRVPLKVIKHQHPEVTGRAPQLVTWPEKKQKKTFLQK